METGRDIEMDHSAESRAGINIIEGFCLASLICGIAAWSVGLFLLASFDYLLVQIELSAPQYLFGYLSSLALAVLAIVFARVGRGRLARKEATAGQGYAIAGRVLGILYFTANVLAAIGFVVLISHVQQI